ncbi:unnamed protein product [Urochloa humidicola]
MSRAERAHYVNKPDRADLSRAGSLSSPACRYLQFDPADRKMNNEECVSLKFDLLQSLSHTRQVLSFQKRRSNCCHFRKKKGKCCIEAELAIIGSSNGGNL